MKIKLWVDISVPISDMFYHLRKETINMSVRAVLLGIHLYEYTLTLRYKKMELWRMHRMHGPIRINLSIYMHGPIKLQPHYLSVLVQFGEAQFCTISVFVRFQSD